MTATYYYLPAINGYTCQIKPKFPEGQMAKISSLSTVTKSESVHGESLAKEKTQGGAPDKDEVRHHTLSYSNTTLSYSTRLCYNVQARHPVYMQVFDSIKTLLAELRAQMQCDAILFVPSGVFVDGVLVDSLADSDGNKLPQLLSAGSTANVCKEDWDVSAGTPIGQANASGTPVEVSNILIDERFAIHISKVNKDSVSQLCVPMGGRIILSAINKTAPNSNKVISDPHPHLTLILALTPSPSPSP